MQVEVVFALAEKQVLRAVELPEGATVAEVIEASNIAQQFPGTDLGKLPSGVWGKRVERSYVVRDGDRVELYRPLENEPREARRLKAEV
jgi:putative ubiquitin-RnfH superfamily antitoxin RatB of RatAB toxin-antitoxin module